MANLATEEQWKDRYRDLVRELEEKERAWATLEAALRAAAGKLALAAMGQSAAVDAAVDHVVVTLRTEPTAGNVDSSLTGLVRALQEQSAPGATPGSAPVAARDLAPWLRRLIVHLSRLPPLAEAAKALDRRLDAGIPDDGWESFLRGVAAAVGEVVSDLQAQRRELEEFLAQVTNQLAQFERWTSSQAGAAQTQREDSLGLERGVQAEMQGLHREVEASPDLVSLKVKVQARLNTVAQQLREFRFKEEQRLADSERQTAELRKEVKKLKGRTDELSKTCADQESRLMLDSLTGAHSRYAYDRRLAEEFRRWQRHSQPLAFSIWDIDFFKRVNDTYGHDAGDRLLRAVADLLNRNKRAEDFLARIGGEEFALLLPMTSVDAAAGVANKLRSAVEAAAFQHHGARVPVTISCGLTAFRAGDTPESVYERADRALYQAKAQGRNRCVAD